MLGKDLDAVGESGALDPHAQAECLIVDIDPALSRQEGLSKKGPQVAAAFAHLQCSFYAILSQVVLKLQQVLDCILIICVNGDPFTSLRGGVNGVKSDRHFAFEVLANGL